MGVIRIISYSRKMEDQAKAPLFFYVPEKKVLLRFNYEDGVDIVEDQSFLNEAEKIADGRIDMNNIEDWNYANLQDLEYEDQTKIYELVGNAKLAKELRKTKESLEEKIWTIFNEIHKKPNGKKL